ncbi:DUF4105 domain-containing protein [Pseudoxanthomonas mexicana]|uniref:Lnb N-terminal periplasmic domain-containing protein n=1 Tax=Pseudoxanthomonas mexicana TaxID=128785 RepID=UPI00398B81EB
MNPVRRRWLALWWWAACLVPPAAQAARLESEGLSATQAQASQALIDEAMQRLPPAWAASLPAGLTLRWRGDLPAQVHGRAQGRRIALASSLLDDWMSRPADAMARRAALAALLHELAHVHDRSPQGGLSRDPRLLDLAGWQPRPLRAGLRERRNDFRDRSPDAYELTRPAEFVAVNLEHFLLDPEYACRRPALHRHFAAHFGWAPPTSADCAPGMVYLQGDVAEAGEALLRIDPERVHEVDYLLAEPHQRQPMSRWGHSMLRLVICAPGRPRGPDCRLDLQHHRVLSFRAFVDDVQVSNWRGLTGSYPSRLFVLPLEQVVDEYTQVELRGLRSLPLRLERGEIAGLLERAAQLHWSYDGRYYFLSNNCAVETWKLLRAGAPRLAGERLSSITPTGLLRRLQRKGIADASVLDDGDRALRLGYRFDAASAHYQAMYEVARERLGLAPVDDEGWLALEPTRRRPVLQRADLRAAAALLLLEQAALRRQEAQARDELKRRLLGRGMRAPREVAEEVRAFLQLGGLLSRPAQLLEGEGYGLPQAAERVRLQREGEHHAAQWREQAHSLRMEARRWLEPSRRFALEATEANLDALGERLRQLHQLEQER